MATGGIVGGIIGNQIGGRQGSIVGVLIGTAIGGVIGYEIGRSLNEQDRKVAYQKFALGMNSGQTGQRHSWTTPDKTAVANYTPLASTSRTAKARLVRPSNVVAPSELEVIAAPHRTPRSVNIRSIPAATGQQVGKLEKGEEVMVVGKVVGQPWYLLSRNNTTLGYVSADLMGPAGGEVPGATLLVASDDANAMPMPSAGMEASDIPIRTTCRDMTYEIVKDGSMAENGTFGGCKQIDGNWVIGPAGQAQQASAG